MKRSQVEVRKFGGIEEVAQVKMNGHDHDVQSVEAQSTTKLEDDMGYGNAAIIRCFKFGINPTVFQQYPPTKQELFNSHYKGIEIALWRDGLKVIPDVNPRIVVDQKSMSYQIFVGAHPMKGHLLREQPKTLSQLAHG